MRNPTYPGERWRDNSANRLMVWIDQMFDRFDSMEPTFNWRGLLLPCNAVFLLLVLCLVLAVRA